METNQGLKKTIEAPCVTLCLKMLVVVAFLCVLEVASALVLPIVVGGFIALFSSPLVWVCMHYLHFPRVIASAVVVALVVVSVFFASSMLIDPALRWAEAIPIVGDRLMYELEIDNFDSIGAGNSAQGNKDAINSAMEGAFAKYASIFAISTMSLLAQIVSTIIITYFFLAYGNDLLRNIVKAQSKFSQKKTTVQMFQTVREDISKYVLLVTLINIGLGLCTAGILTLINFEDALLWGGLAAVLNYAPYIGPLILATVLTCVGFATGDPIDKVFIAPACFMALNFVESQFVTPTILGKRFNLNPLLLILWMFLWGWIWGPVGMLIAIPILMCFKLMCIHLDLIGDWVEVFNTGQGERLREV